MGAATARPVVGSAPLSYSSVRTYLECPLRWKYLYIDHLSEAPKGYFSFGRTIHSVLEELLRPFVPAAASPAASRAAQTTLESWTATPAAVPSTGLLSESALLELYRRKWVSDGYLSKEDEERYRSQGEELLLAYRGLLERIPPAPVAVEQHLSATWDGIPIHGYIDRIDQTPRGTLEILDYKTTRNLSYEDAKGSEQLALYQVLVERNYPAKVEALTLYHLRALRPLTVPPKRAEEIDTLYQRVGQVRDGIRERDFEPTPGRHCHHCDFRSICPEFRQIDGPERERLAALAEQFVSLREKEGAIELELRRIAGELHRAAQVNNLHRVALHNGTLLRVRDRPRQHAARPVGEGGLIHESAAPGATAGSHDQDPPTAEGGGTRTDRYYWEYQTSED